jgi:hypothetical protein
MRGAIPPLPQYVFMAWCLVKHRDSFTFTFIPETFCRNWRKTRKNVVGRDSNWVPSEYKFTVLQLHQPVTYITSRTPHNREQKLRCMVWIHGTRRHPGLAPCFKLCRRLTAGRCQTALMNVSTSLPLLCLYRIKHKVGNSMYSPFTLCRPLRFGCAHNVDESTTTN